MNMNFGQSKMASISRNVIVQPLIRHLPLSSLGRIRPSNVQPHKFLYNTSDGGNKHSITLTDKNGIDSEMSLRRNPITMKFPPTNYALADQVFDDIPPSSRFSNPINMRHKQLNNTVFPWRHSPHNLPRLTPNTVEAYEEGGEFGPHFPMKGMNVAEQGFLWFHSVYVLGLRRPWLYARWRRDLEDGFLSAFAMGLQGVLTDVYRAPTSLEGDDKAVDDGKNMGESDDEDNAYNVRIDHTIEKLIESADDDPPNDSTDTIIEKADEGYEAKKKTQFNKSAINDNDHQLEERPSIHNMLESNLQSLYHSAHAAAKSKLQIHLECQPKSAHLLSLFTVPLLTREEVRQTPSLQSLYPDLYHKLLVKAFEEMERSNGRNVSLSWRQVYEELKEFVDDKVGKQEDEGVIQMTVVAQAVIECDEVFYVKDVASGEVVQGDADGKMKQVLHLVRFEMVVDWDWQRQELQTGNWQITDWDDLLDGNIYYL